jgi:hypothetical protein
LGTPSYYCRLPVALLEGGGEGWRRRWALARLQQQWRGRESCRRENDEAAPIDTAYHLGYA